MWPAPFNCFTIQNQLMDKQKHRIPSPHSPPPFLSGRLNRIMPQVFTIEKYDIQELRVAGVTDAARYARARKISTKYEGGRKRRPMN